VTTITLVRQQPITDDEIRQAVRARRSLMAFCQWVDPAYEDPPHLRLLAAELEAIERGENDRLIVMMPPRYGKSTMVSVHFPAWYLSRHPERHWISASYGAELAYPLGRQARNLMLSERRSELFPDVTVTKDSAAAHRWSTNHGGQFVATGIPGPITGRGAHVLNIDDPLRGIADAYSETVREAIWQWWTTDARTRLEPGGAVIVTLTRWHEDDLVGRLLSQQGDRWRVLRLPALAEHGDPLGRAVTERLWPERFSAEELEDTRHTLGERAWSALYQQSPAPQEGHIFRYWHHYDALPPKLDSILIPLDSAYTAADRADYTAWAAWGTKGNESFLFDADSCQEQTPEAERRLFYFYSQLRERFPETPISVLVRSRVAIDRVMAQHLRIRHIPVVEVDLPAGNTKESLANIAVTQFEGQLAKVPLRQPPLTRYADFERKPWLESWMAEHVGFPTARHDDWVETTIIVQMHLHLGWRVPLRGPPMKTNLRTSAGANGNGRRYA